MATSAGATDALTQALIAWIDRLFPDPPRGERLKLEFVAGGSLTPDAESPGWPPSDPGQAHARAAYVREVTRRADGVGVLALDGLDDAGVAAPYLEAAFALLRSSRGVVLDLRANGGGDAGTVALVLGWLLGQEPTHLSDVIYRDRTRHHLQSQGRGRIAGQASRGAADHVTPIRLSSHVRAFIPEGYVRDAVTGGNWKGAGVVPDVAVAEGDALEAAVEHLFRAIR